METTDALDALPTDFESLQQLCLEQAKLLQQHQLSLEKKQHRIDILEELLSSLKRKHYSSGSERHIAQAELFNEAEQLISEATEELQQASSITDEPPAEEEKNQSSPSARGKRGRKKLPASLPRVKVYHDLKEPDKV